MDGKKSSTSDSNKQTKKHFLDTLSGPYMFFVSPSWPEEKDGLESLFRPIIFHSLFIFQEYKLGNV